ncbi:MAG: thiamine phosphate synthase [Deltaproteobacteria bacterium]|nr:MAG: thiamine phosphate synthase [Deltaproteobacteria bacterium]
MKLIEGLHLYCFTPGPFSGGRDPLEVVEQEIRGGADVIQLREKQMSKRERLEFGLKVRELTRRYGVLFIVNDDVDLAMILDADGVHLGQDDIPIQYARPLIGDKLIGISTHSLEQVKQAVEAGADYIGFGPIFDTTTKQDREQTVGLELLAEVRDICPIPYVAIGGIKRENLSGVIEAGCNRVAIISDILLANDVEERCREIKRQLVTMR